MTPLGCCPTCGHLVRLTPAGTLAAHLRDGVIITRARHRRWRCPGSGRWPAEADTTSPARGGSPA